MVGGTHTPCPLTRSSSPQPLTLCFVLELIQAGVTGTFHTDLLSASWVTLTALDHEQGSIHPSGTLLEAPLPSLEGLMSGPGVLQQMRLQALDPNHPRSIQTANGKSMHWESGA